MSQTARDTITRAMRMLGVIMAGTTPTAPQANNGLIALNAMMHGWKAQAVDIGHTDLTLNDDLDVDDAHINGTTALLAIELSPEFMVQPGPAVVAIATNGWSGLKAAYITDDITHDMTVERGLRGVRRFGTYTG